MDGRAASTGALPAVGATLGLMTYPPQVASVRSARRFVESVITDTALRPLADDAGLLVSELAANAVLHARSEFDVAVTEIAGGIRVSVRDRSAALPVLTAPSATAMSGRGMALVQTLSTQWGAGSRAGSGKSVWFELLVDHQPLEVGAAGADWSDAAAAELSVDDLLAAWGDAEEQATVVTPTGQVSGGERVAFTDTAGFHGGAEAAGVEVALPELVADELLAAKEQMEDVLRELQLVLLDERGQQTGAAQEAFPEDVEIARRLDEAARGFDDVRRQVRHQVSRAVAAGAEYVVLRLRLVPGVTARARAYRSAVEAAEQFARRGGLLSASGGLQRYHSVRRAYLDEVIAAADGGLDFPG